jgi:hypothetical protein
MFVIPDANTLVTYVKDWTGSSNDAEIRECIFMAELMMRNIELPALRTNPYTTTATMSASGTIPIPGDMNKPILFFITGNTNGGTTPSPGPWIVFDRIGDRDIIAQSLINQWYLQPTNVPQVIHGNFSEVSNTYQFVPFIGAGTIINLYYYRAWDLLFTPTTITQTFSTTGTVGAVSGSGPWTYQLSGLTTTTGVLAGDIITSTAGTGKTANGGVATVVSVASSTALNISVTGGSAPVAGTVTNVIYSRPSTVQTNEVLQSWPEGYVYSTLHCYYTKRHSAEDAAMYLAKYDEAWRTVENQNNLGKWNGGNTRLTSIFQPRRMNLYSTK